MAFYYLAHEYLTPTKKIATKFERELIDWLLLGLLIASFTASAFIMKNIP